MVMVLQKRPRRRPSTASYYVISGEVVTREQASVRLGITSKTFDARRSIALKKLEPGEILTWEMLERKS